MKKIILSIDGMTCSACSNGLEKYLNKQQGIIKASVNLVMANTTIEYDEGILDQVKIEEFVKQAGFKSLGKFKEIKIEKSQRKDKIKFIFFTILAIILMYVSMGHMLNLPIPLVISPHYMNGKNYTVLLFVLTLFFVVYGFDILKNGYKNLVHKTPNMDTLVSIGVISSFLYSLYSMYMIIKGNSNYIKNLYFESTSIVIYFVKLGRYIDHISRDKTKESIVKLVEMTPNTAIIKTEKGEKEVTLDEINVGDIIISRPGSKIAVDGEITFGKTHLDESFITGESKPISKEIGSKVIAGSINYDGYIEYKAERIGASSTISEIVRLVVEASNTKAPIANMADKVSGYFVPTIIIIAFITFIFYLFLGKSFNESLITFVTILVIACPCSLGLATPLAIIVSEGLCANNGILIKKSEILENAQKTNIVVFDKTGTLTYGKLKISEIFNYSNMSDDQLLQLAGSLESKSSHPIGKAFIDYLKEKNIKIKKVEKFENIAGYGIIGQIQKENIILGNSKILEKYKINNPYLDNEKKLVEKGNSIVYVVENNKIIALIGVNDVVKENAREVIDALKENKIQTIMLTGDNYETANKIAEKIGISKVIANVLPKEKAKLIKDLKQEGKFIIMCGDGINDSPALANADIGISVNSGTDIAIDSADVVLTRDNLNSIIDLLNISKKTIKIIKQNLFWAFVYNFLMISIAIGVLKPIGISLNPMLASMAMVFSSITVVLNTLRLKRINLSNNQG